MKPSNMASLREALEIAKKAICNHVRASHTCDSLAWENSTINANCGDILCAHRDLCEAKTAIQKALAKPPRNCDVGDEEEQAQRIDAFCKSHGIDQNGCYRCEECPLLEIDRCELKWAQMPYESQNKKADERSINDL